MQRRGRGKAASFQVQQPFRSPYAMPLTGPHANMGCRDRTFLVRRSSRLVDSAVVAMPGTGFMPTGWLAQGDSQHTGDGQLCPRRCPVRARSRLNFFNAKARLNLAGRCPLDRQDDKRLLCRACSGMPRSSEAPMILRGEAASTPGGHDLAGQRFQAEFLWPLGWGRLVSQPPRRAPSIQWAGIARGPVARFWLGREPNRPLILWISRYFCSPGPRARRRLLTVGARSAG